MKILYYIIEKYISKEWVNVSGFPDYYYKTKRLLKKIKTTDKHKRYRIRIATLEDVKQFNKLERQKQKTNE